MRNSQLRLQGHATSHAIFREGPRHCYVPRFFVTKIMLLILPDWKVRQIRKITVPIKQIIRWLLLTNLTGKPGISDLRL